MSPTSPDKTVVHYTVQVQPNTRLEELCARWLATKAAAETAAEAFNSLKAEIKNEAYEDAQQHRPDATRIHITGMVEVPLTLSYSETRRFQTKDFKAAYPDLYEQYRPTTQEIAGKGSWSLGEG